MEIVQLGRLGIGTGCTTRHLSRVTAPAETESLLRLKTQQARLSDRSAAMPSGKKDLPAAVTMGAGLDWQSPLIDVDLYVELPFWVLAPADTVTVLVGETNLQIEVLQDWVEIVEGHRYTSSHGNALRYAQLTSQTIDELEKQSPNPVSYRTLRTTLRIRTRIHQDMWAAYSGADLPRAQRAALYLRALACAHVPFVARFVNAYRVASNDPFAFDVSEPDLPFWFARVNDQWIGASLAPYHTFDQYPYARDFSGARAQVNLTTAESLRAALAEEPFPGHLEMLDAWGLRYRGKYAEAIRLLASAVEIALDEVFRRFLSGKGRTEDQIEDRLAKTFNNFDGRLEDYLRASERRLPGPMVSFLPYINGLRYREELEHTRGLRHKIVHEGRRIDSAQAGDVQRAMETTTWLFRWLVSNEENTPELRADGNPLMSSLRGDRVFGWSYTPTGVVINSSPAQIEMATENAGDPWVLTSDTQFELFERAIDGDKRDPELFVRMFFGFIGLASPDAPLPPENVTCEHERYLVHTREGGCQIPVFLFDLDGLPALAHLHSVAARILMRGSAPQQGAKALCVFNHQRHAPWRLREDAFGDGAFRDLARMCGIVVCSTADLLLTINAGRRHFWAARDIEVELFRPGALAPPGCVLVGTVNKYYERPRALSINVSEGQELRKNATIVVRLKDRFHQQPVSSLTLNKEKVEVVTGPARAGVAALLDRVDVFENGRGLVWQKAPS